MGERVEKCFLAFLFQLQQFSWLTGPGGKGRVTNRMWVEKDSALFSPLAGPAANGASRMVASGGPLSGVPQGGTPRGRAG